MSPKDTRYGRASRQPFTRRGCIRSQRGAITLVALCFTAIIGIALASYIAVCYRSLTLSWRTMLRKQAYQLCETGLEEALWSLNSWASLDSSLRSTAWNGWSSVGSTKTRTLTGYSLDSGATGQIAVTVANWNYVNNGGSTPVITAAVTVTLLDGTSLQRTLRGTTTNAPAFPNGVASANSFVYLVKGTFDSYNSADGAYGGSNIGYANIIAGNYSGPYGVYLNQSTVKGYVATYDKSVSWSTSGTPKGTVKGPSTPSGTSVDTSRLSKSAFVPLFTVQEPTGSYAGWITPSNDDGNFGTAGATTPEIWYASDSNGDLNLSNWETLRIDGPVKIIVARDLNITDTGHIDVRPTGSLEIFVRRSINITSTYGIRRVSAGATPANLTPSKVAIYNTGSYGTFTYGTSADFYGVMYSTSPGILVSSSAEIYGAVLSDSYIYFASSSPAVHYDTALRTARFDGIETPFLVDQITEL